QPCKAWRRDSTMSKVSHFEPCRRQIRSSGANLGEKAMRLRRRSAGQKAPVEPFEPKKATRPMVEWQARMARAPGENPFPHPQTPPTTKRPASLRRLKTYARIMSG